MERVFQLLALIIFGLLLGCREHGENHSVSSSAGDAKKANEHAGLQPIKVPLRMIPGDEGAQQFYEHVMSLHVQYGDGQKLDLLLSQIENHRYILVEQANAGWGIYDFVLFDENGPDAFVAYTRDKFGDGSLRTRQVPAEVVNSMFEKLKKLDDQCPRQWSRQTAGADLDICHFRWSDGDTSYEYWVLGHFLMVPERIEGGLEPQCLHFLRALNGVFQVAREHF